MKNLTQGMQKPMPIKDNLTMKSGSTNLRKTIAKLKTEAQL